MAGRDDDDDDRDPAHDDEAGASATEPIGSTLDPGEPATPRREPDAPQPSKRRASESQPDGESSSSGPLFSRRAVRIRSLPPPPPGDSGASEPLVLGTADEETFELGPVVDIGALPRGTMIAGHVLLGRLGEDGLGPIYSAFDNEGERKLALRLLPVPGDDPESVDAQLALVEELTAVSRISHPCIVEVRDVGVWSGGVYVAMDFFDGIDLATWIEARDEPFPWREVVRVFREAGRALAAAHAGGVLHRDFSPAKVLLGRGGQIRVIDFGLAQAATDESDDLSVVDRLRAKLGLPAQDDEPSRELGGAIAYAAPEVLVGEPPDPRSDEYSFCASLYEALYGEGPYAGEQRGAIASEMLDDRLRAAPRDTDVPEWLRAVVVRGLAVRPADRWPSMERLLRELDRDPAASRRRWQRGLLLVGVLGGAASAVAWWAAATQERCAAGDVELAGVWDQQRRIEVERAFTASDKPYAADSFRAVADSIDGWTRGWAQLQVEACEATRVRGDADEELYARRRECLDDHLQELSALLGVLESVEPSALDRAWVAAAALESPRMCTHPAGLDEVAHPRDADLDRIADARSRIDRGRALLHLGRASAAAELARDLLHDAEGLQHPGLQAAAVRLHGSSELALGHTGPGELALVDAARRAVRDELDYGLALAWVELAGTLARANGRQTEATHMIEYAATVLERIHDDEHRWAIAKVRGEIAAHAGRTTEALARYHEALAELERMPSASPVRIEVLYALGELVATRGDLNAAEGYFTRAIESLRDRLGAGHPELAQPLLRLGALQSSRHATADAQASWERGLVILGDAHGLEAPTTVRALLGIATQLRDDGEAISALDYDRRALLAVERAPERDEQLLIAALVDQSRTLLALGRDRQALVLLQRANDVTEAAHRTAVRSGTPDVRRSAAARLVESQGLLARAMWSDKPARPRALELAGKARALAHEHELPVDPWVASVAEHITEGSAP